VRLDVTDTSIGISSNELAQLFGKFYRARNQTTLSTPDTGLGLTITKALVEMHGSTVSVASTPGEETTFGFAVPVAPEVAEPPMPNPAAPSSGNILLVEDNADTARLVARYLERAGHTVLTAATGEDAIELAFVERPALVLLDLVVSDMDGLEVLEPLKADPETRAIPVIVLSMLPDEGEGQRLGAVAHLGKPVDERVLLNRISSLVRHDQVSTVLVADDDSGIRRPVATMRARSGYHAVEAADGAEAVAVAIREAPASALLDVRMPRTDGIEGLRKLRAEPITRDIAVVMMTVHPETLTDPSNAIDDLGITDLMHKPFSPDDLLAIVDRVTTGDQTG
jgi:CheY-like chemotaxis protein